ncbi:hypothetical protein GCM10009798_33360 [Nocardioides panacihumi]|uniref:Uncharacterized protein n=1 Tax=Nocardioides panacihumi TaxID=400774 RepID=A0ABN2RJH6_9ACTN
MTVLLRRTAPPLAAAVAGVCLSPVLPVHAEAAVIRDRAGDISQPWDLHRVDVRNNARNVWIKMSFRDLAPDEVAGASLFLNTDLDQRPDFVFNAGLFDGTDYQLATTNSWNVRKPGEMVNCSYRMWLDYATNTARVRFSKACLSSSGNGTVRVEVRTSGQDGEGGTIVDWLGKGRRFSRTIAQR